MFFYVLHMVGMRASHDLTQESNKLYISLNQLFFNVIRILTKHIMTCFYCRTIYCILSAAYGDNSRRERTRRHGGRSH